MKKIWINQKFRQLGLWALFMVIGGLGTVVFYKLVDTPFNVFELLASGALIILCGIGAFKTCQVIVQLLNGPPKAGKTPEEVVGRFFKSVLIASGTLDLGTVRSDAIFTLSPNVFNEIGGWDGFREYWTAQNNAVLDKLTDSCAPIPVTKTLFKLGQITKMGNDMDGKANRKIVVTYSAVTGAGTTLNPEKTIGSWSFESVCELKEDNGLWYVTNPKMKIKQT